MKKILAVLLCLALAVLLTACGSVSVSTDVIKPTRAPAATATPVPSNVKLPDGASYLGGRQVQENNYWIEETSFSYNGVTWYYRTAQTAELQNISGVYAEGLDAQTQLAAGSPRCSVNEWGQGVLIWYEDGRSCSVSVLENADRVALVGVYHAITGK